LVETPLDASARPIERGRVQFTAIGDKLARVLGGKSRRERRIPIRDVEREQIRIRGCRDARGIQEVKRRPVMNLGRRKRTPRDLRNPREVRLSLRYPNRVQRGTGVGYAAHG
jgi:hypothetical protein